MKIKQIYLEGKTCPFLVCELCDKIIKHKIKNTFEEEGMVFWKDADDKGDIGTIIAHKKCMLENKTADDLYLNSVELKYFFFNLLHNSKIKPGRFPVEF
jgi:hypothetical protein